MAKVKFTSEDMMNFDKVFDYVEETWINPYEREEFRKLADKILSIMEVE